MSFEYLADPARGPQWSGLLPGQIMEAGREHGTSFFPDMTWPEA